MIDTETVRSAYIESYAATASYNGEQEWGEEFDNWLANYTCDILYDAASRLNSYHPAWEQLHDMAEQAREKGVMREH